MELSAVIAFAAIAFTVIAVPGPDWAYALATGAHDRVVPPMVSGIALGYALITTVVAFGVGPPITAHPLALTALTVGGAAYLVYHGVRVLTAPAEPVSAQAGSTPAASTRHLPCPGHQGQRPETQGPADLRVDAAAAHPTHLGLAAAVQLAALGGAYALICARVYFPLGHAAGRVLGARHRAAQIATRVAVATTILVGPPRRQPPGAARRARLTDRDQRTAAHRPADSPAGTRPVHLLAALAVGMLLPAQGRITGALGVRLKDGAQAALLASIAGLFLVAVIALAAPSARHCVARIPDAVRRREAFPRWALLAGIPAAYFIFAQGVVAGVSGIALFTIAFVAGQTLGGIGVDLWGIGPAGRRHITWPRTTGSVVIVAAVVLSVASGGTHTGSTATVLLLLLPFTAGLGNSVQTVMNGLQTAHYGNFVPATLINFIVGVFVLAIPVTVRSIEGGGWSAPPTEPWLYLGGPLGVLIVGQSAYLAKHLGVLLTSLGLIAGQLLGALAIDLIWPAPHTSGFPWHELVGTLLGVTGVALASLDRHRRPRRSGPYARSRAGFSDQDRRQAVPEEAAPEDHHLPHGRDG
ncbi:LysE family transporter [Actinacidiphila glaucinigra]|uniref:LysE family transporter n=1 Tax=Actinacidiphila glaucinigra TaxID=235986 RepID=UPI00366FBAE7